MRALCLVILCVPLLLACATPGAGVPAAADAAAVSLRMPYRSGGAGMGGTAVSDMALVPPGKHPPYLAALGLQKALSRFNAGLVQPEILTLTAADKDVRWRSDIGPLQADQIASYNAAGSHAPLRDRLFGVAFAGRLLVIDNELRFSIEARLSSRGAGESWRALDEKDYSGAFFARLLAGDLQAQLRAIGKPAP